MKRIVLTGAGGLLGWHAHVRLHAANCAARFKGQPLPYEVVALNHSEFDKDDTLQLALANADAVLHFAGINRASAEEVEYGNTAIAARLVDNCRSIGANPHIVYANSMHSTLDTPYGRGKKSAAEILRSSEFAFTDLVLPHIFGECARPNYNNVTATLIQHILEGKEPTVNPDGQVQLLHAGIAVQAAIDAVDNCHGVSTCIASESVSLTVNNLLEKLKLFHQSYIAGVYPDLSSDFDLALFNSYRAASYPRGWPRQVTLHSDERGVLFEAVKSAGGGQTFLSTTKPGVTRGDHFHLHKVERFLVLQGNAIIRIRKVHSDEIWEYPVSGDVPVCVDMPTMHTHSIENVGNKSLVTLFWANRVFDPEKPDTYTDMVLD